MALGIISSLMFLVVSCSSRCRCYVSGIVIFYRILFGRVSELIFLNGNKNESGLVWILMMVFTQS